MAFDGYNASRFTMFYPDAMSAEDMVNFKRSLSPQIMLFWDQATPDALKRLSQVVRHNPYTGKDEPVRVLLRLGEEAFNRDAGKLQDEAYDKTAAGKVTTAFMGNEIDAPFSLRWHDRNGQSVDWGNTNGRGEMSPLNQRVNKVLRAAGALDGVIDNLISPGYIMRGFSEDDAPDPGLYSWRELSAHVYYGYGSPINGNGVHFYDYGWWLRDPAEPVPAKVNADGNLYLEHEAAEHWANALVGARVATWTNVSRFMHSVRFWSGFHHHLCYWDEVNTFNSALSEAEHIEACIGKSKLLIHHKNGEGYQLGERVAMYCPFTFNGIPNAYPAQYIMRSKETIEAIRAHMIEEGYKDA